MKRRKTRIYALVIGVGLCALIADWLARSGGSATPTSAVANPAANAAGTAGAEHDDRGWTAVSVLAFPKTGSEESAPVSARDPFRLTERVRSALSPESAVQALGVEPARHRADSFAEEHVLTAILRVGASRVAVVDGLMIEEGQSIDGCEVERIAARSVRFECADGEVELDLEDPIDG